jgi:predicted amidohydrolase
MRYAAVLENHCFIIYGNRSRSQHRQYLCHARWEDTRKTWMNHGIPTYWANSLEAKPLGTTHPKSLNDLFDGMGLHTFCEPMPFLQTALVAQ